MITQTEVLRRPFFLPITAKVCRCTNREPWIPGRRNDCCLSDKKAIIVNHSDVKVMCKRPISILRRIDFPQ